MTRSPPDIAAVGSVAGAWGDTAIALPPDKLIQAMVERAVAAIAHVRWLELPDGDLIGFILTIDGLVFDFTLRSDGFALHFIFLSSR